MATFRLSEVFLESYRKKLPEFGFNGLGELVYYHHYSRVMKDGRKEKWVDTIQRVVEGTMNILIKNSYFGPVHGDQEAVAREMFELMFDMKFLPPGRGLWAMGTSIIKEKGGAALNNCAFISTVQEPKRADSYPFVFAMDMLMLGVGVGFDTTGKIMVRRVHSPYSVYHEIEDTREGWVKSVELVLDYYFVDNCRNRPLFSYERIRKKGSPLKTFGGKASGPDPLRKLHQSLDDVLSKLLGKPLGEKGIVDIMNLLGRCVVAGNVRRSAELAVGSFSKEFLELKDYEVNPERQEWGWCSNNSVDGSRLETGDLEEIAKRIRKNGEPGIVWIQNMKNYGRMNGKKDRSDADRIIGTNPCGEQTLESGELCCLVEVFLNNHHSYYDLEKTLSYAYLYAKAVTLVPIHNQRSNEIVKRNRRIGISLTGIAQFLAEFGIFNLRKWCSGLYGFLKGLDKITSVNLDVPMSKKITCVKPSGTVSLLAGATPGMHYPQSRFYLRRMRLGNGDRRLVTHLISNGYEVVEDPYNKEGWVVSFPVDVGEGVRTMEDVDMFEQMSLTSDLQRYWADNQVSCTVTFDTKTEGHKIATALAFFSDKLKSISMLPKCEEVYPMMPYQKISKTEYDDYLFKIHPLDLDMLPDEVWLDPLEETLCTSDSCTLKQQ